MYAKMTSTDLMFSESPDKITSEMSVTVLGDLGNFCDTGNVGSDVSVFFSSGNIFRRESSVAPYESWTGQPLQVTSIQQRMSRESSGPIRGQYSGCVTSIDQSEISIQVT